MGQRADRNPVELIKTELSDNEYKLLDWDGTVRLNILPGLNTQVTYSNQYVGSFGGYFLPSTNTKTNMSEANRSYGQTDKSAVEWLVNYNKSFGDHSVKAMAGYSWQSITNSGFPQQTSSLPMMVRPTTLWVKENGGLKKDTMEQVPIKQL